MRKNTLGDDIYAVIGNILRWGVYISMLVVLTGGVVYLYRHGHEHNSIVGKSFVEENNEVVHLIRESFHGIALGKGIPIITIGILLLLATPIARVIFSFFAFMVEKDRMYMLFTLIVLLVIGFSMMTGFGG